MTWIGWLIVGYCVLSLLVGSATVIIVLFWETLEGQRVMRKEWEELFLEDPEKARRLMEEWKK